MLSSVSIGEINVSVTSWLRGFVTKEIISEGFHYRRWWRGQICITSEHISLLKFILSLIIKVSSSSVMQVARNARIVVLDVSGTLNRILSENHGGRKGTMIPHTNIVLLSVT